MNINEIQDYTNRLQRVDTYLQKMKDLSERQKSSGSDFQKVLKEEVNQKIQGKISSADITLPNQIKEEISKDPYRKKLYNASVEFESMFVKIMLNQMRKSVEKQGMIHGGYAEDIFEDMLYDEYAKEMSKNAAFGLAEQIYQSLSSGLPPIVDKKI
jgi:flagellar protein FlgJ